MEQERRTEDNVSRVWWHWQTWGSWAFAVGLVTLAAWLGLRPPSRFLLSSPALGHARTLPARYRCALPSPSSPPLRWSNPPTGTAGFTIVASLQHDGAADAIDRDAVLWVVWNVPAWITELPEGAAYGDAPVPDGANRLATGACPADTRLPGEYRFEVFALDQTMDTVPLSRHGDIVQAMHGHVLARAAVTGAAE